MKCNYVFRKLLIYKPYNYKQHFYEDFCNNNILHKDFHNNNINYEEHA